MSMNAIAVLHVAPSVAKEALAADAYEPLSDAVRIPLGISLAEEPEALAAALREKAGDLVDAHDDPRGVPVYPERLTLDATSWDEVVAELGEAADWVKVRDDLEEPDPMLALMGDPSQLLGGMDMNAMRGMLGGQDPAAMLQGADPAALQALLGGQDASAMMEAAMKMMGQLAETGALADLAKSMGGAGGMPAGLAGSGLDMEKLAAQAQAAIEADPELEAKLRGALEGQGDDDETE